MKHTTWLFSFADVEKVKCQERHNRSQKKKEVKCHVKYIFFSPSAWIIFLFQHQLDDYKRSGGFFWFPWKHTMCTNSHSDGALAVTRLNQPADGQPANVTAAERTEAPICARHAGKEAGSEHTHGTNADHKSAHNFFFFKLIHQRIKKTILTFFLRQQFLLIFLLQC